MAKSFLTDLNLNRNVLLNAKIQQWGSAPSGTGSPDASGNAVAGQISSYSGSLYIFNGSAWVQVGNALSDSTSTTSSTTGASSTAVKAAYDLAAAALPKGGGTMSGNIAMGGGNISGGGTFTATSFVGALTGNASTATTASATTGTLTFGTGLTAGGSSFNGSGNVTITPVSATTSVAGIVQLSDSTSTTGSTKAATETAVKAAYDRGSLGVTNANTAQSTADAALPKAGGTMSGAIAMGNNKITGLATPTDAGDAATKSYVDNVSTGVNIHDAVVAATTGTIAGVYAAGSTTANPPGDGGTGVGATITYSATGVVTLDTSVTLAQGDRVLVKDGVTAAAGASSIANGIYVVTTAGASGVAAILTRSTDADNSHFGDLSAGDLVYVIGGNTYAGDQFVQTVKGTATQGTGADTTYSVKIGTDAVSYTQFSGAGAVPNATTSSLGIASFSNTQFDVATGAVSIKSAAALPSPVITTPTLNGTITLGSTPSFSGAVSFANTLTATGGITMGNVLQTTTNNITQTTGYLSTANIQYTNNDSNAVLWNTTLTIGSISTGGTLTTGSLNLGNGTAWTTGTINIGNGASGSPTIRVGAGNGTAGTATIAIGNNGQSGTNKSTTTIAGIVKLPQVADSTAGFVKTSTDGTLSRSASVAYSELASVGSTTTTTYATSVTTTVARKATGTISGSPAAGASVTVNHGWGLVTAQLFDSSGNQVEVDVTTASGITTFVSPTTALNGYQYVIIG
jgi:hypothetical protein